MHRACSIKKLSGLVLAMILTVSATGCHNSRISSISKGEWIRMIIARAGIQGHAESSPYFMNISAQSAYFDDIQAAVEWHIIDPSYPFEPDELLNNEWTAFTLINLARDMPEGNPSMIKDISKTMFSEQVAAAVASGLMKTDSRNMFKPSALIERDEAEKCLDQVIEYINHRHFDEPQFSIEWQDGVTVYESEPLNVNEETMSTVLPEGSEAEPGDILVSRSGLDYQAYTVTGREGNEATLEECDLFDAVKELNIQGSTEINFNDVEFYDGNGNLVSARPTGNNASDHIFMMADKMNTYRFAQNGFDIVCKTTDSSFTCEAEKKIASGKIYAGLQLSGAKADYSFASLLKDIKNTYWNFSFTSTETLGVQSDIKKAMVGDFSRIDKTNFLSSLQGFMQEKDDAVQSELKIASMRIPIGSLPLCDIVIDVKLQIKTSGKAEIVLSQKNSFGYEFIDGNLRLIKETDHDQNFTLKADTSLSTALTTTLVAAGVKLMDAAINAGAAASIKAKVHLFDDDGKMESYEVDSSADLAEEMSSEVEDVVVCADASGNWLLDLTLFSKNCAANKYIGETKFSILNAKNAPLFKGASQHFENWQAVDHCTRKDRPKAEERETMETRGKISLDQYSMAVHIGESRSISIIGLPSGYSFNDLTVSSSDPSVASVSGLVVSGISSGSAVITVSTADGSFHAACNILVPQGGGS